MYKFEILIGLLTRDGAKVPTCNVLDTCNAYFDGFSVSKQTGYYKGNKEKSLCITILAPDTDSPQIERLSKHLQELCEQDSVYIARTHLSDFIDVNSEFVPRETYNSRVKK